MTRMTLVFVLAFPLAALGCGGDGGGGPRGPDDPPSIGVQIDRVGRPAISTALIGTFEANPATRDAMRDDYNRATPADAASWVAEIAKNLAILDSLDANCGNQLLAGATAAPGRYDALATILADDRLFLDAGRATCGEYLALEAEEVGVLAPGTGGCGGRTPADDVIERSYSVLAAGALDGFDDTITADDGAQTTTFPFLGPP